MFGVNLIERYLYSLPEYRQEFQQRHFIEIYSYNGLLATRKIIEFDGNTVLCRVCGDKASGFHYGVHACEGCKGFFRRSIQQKIQYRPCLKNQQCNIMRVNRNRCQYCRLKKCIAVGMSRDAVRFGRVPKREKAKIMEQMQKVNAQAQMNLLSTVLENDSDFVQKIINAHMETCDFTRSKFRAFVEKVWTKPQYVSCPAQMACPLNPRPEMSDSNQQWEEFSDCFTPAIRSVVSFAKCVPGFQVFSQEDQVTLLKAGTFEVLLVHLACLFDHKSSTMMFANGKLYKKTSHVVTNSAGFLLDSMFDFAERVNRLQLTDEEIALFSALVITASDRPGLRNVEHVDRVQRKITHALQTVMRTNHSDESVFTQLMMKVPDLRTLNTLHSEKLLGLTVPPTGQNGGTIPMNRIHTLTNECAPTLKEEEEEEEEEEADSSLPAEYWSTSLPGMGPGMGSGMGSGMPGGPDMHHLSHSIASRVMGDGPPIIPHQVAMETDKKKELILQTPIGSFHRYPPLLNQYSDFHRPEHEGVGGKMSDDGSRSVDMTVDMDEPRSKNGYKTQASQGRDEAFSCDEGNRREEGSSSRRGPLTPPQMLSHSLGDGSRSDIPIDADMLANQMPCLSPMAISSPANQTRDDVVMAEPQSSAIPCKRPKSSMELELEQAKMLKMKMWEYDMRSSRSNSMSSSSSLESTDSAYRTMSQSGTPRSSNFDQRSPYSSMEHLRLGLRKELSPESLHEQNTYLNEMRKRCYSDCQPLRRQLLIQRAEAVEKTTGSSGKNAASASSSGSSSSSSRSSSPADSYKHKKLIMQQYLSENRNMEDGGCRRNTVSFPLKRKNTMMSEDISMEMTPAGSYEALGAASSAADLEANLRNLREKLVDMDHDHETEADMSSVETDTVTVTSETAMVDDLREPSTASSPPATPTAHMGPKVPSPPLDDFQMKPRSHSFSGSLPYGRYQRNSLFVPPPESGLLRDHFMGRPWDNPHTTLSSPGASDSKPESPTGTKSSSSRTASKHPLLLSRLSTAPKVNNLHLGNKLVESLFSGDSKLKSATKIKGQHSNLSPPLLGAINEVTLPRCRSADNIHQVASERQSAKQYLGSTDMGPLDHMNHLSAMSTLKDKLLQRIDSRENLHQLPASGQHSPNSRQPDVCRPKALLNEKNGEAIDEGYCGKKQHATYPPQLPIPSHQRNPQSPANLPCVTQAKGMPHMAAAPMYPPGMFPPQIHQMMLYNQLAAIQQMHAFQQLQQAQGKMPPVSMGVTAASSRHNAAVESARLGMAVETSGGQPLNLTKKIGLPISIKTEPV